MGSKETPYEATRCVSSQKMSQLHWRQFRDVFSSRRRTSTVESEPCTAAQTEPSVY